MSCRTAKPAIRDWFDLYQNKISTGRSGRVIYVLLEGKPNPRLRCEYTQAPARGGNNPFARVRCKARGGYRLSFEGYA